MSDLDYDDRCDDEAREGAMAAAHASECMADYGVPYDPYEEEGEE